MNKIKKYYSGEAATAVGLSIEGIKYYEKQKIISSFREENGYRYYRYVDIIPLSNHRSYQSYGMVKENVIELMKSSDLKSTRKLLQDHLSFMNKNIKIEKIKVQKLHQQLEYLEHLEQYNNKYHLVETQECYLLNLGDDRKLKKNKKLNCVCKEMYLQMPLAESIHIVSKNIVEHTFASLGFRICKTDLDYINITYSEFLEYKPKRTAIMTIQQTPKDKMIFEFTESIRAYITSNNMKIIDNIEITHIATVDGIGYYQYLIPIES